MQVRAHVRTMLFMTVDSQHFERVDVARADRHDAGVFNTRLFLQFAESNCFEVAFTIGVSANPAP